MPESFKQYAGTSTTRFYIVFDLIASLMIGGIMYIAGNELTGATFIWQALGLAYISNVFYKQYHVKKVVDEQPVEVVAC